MVLKEDLEKRFYVFEIVEHNGCVHGGMNDVVYCCDTEDEYIDYIAESQTDGWYEIFDTVSKEYHQYFK